MALQLTYLVELNYFNSVNNEIFTHTLLQLGISVYLFENSVFNRNGRQRMTKEKLLDKKIKEKIRILIENLTGNISLLVMFDVPSPSSRGTPNINSILVTRHCTEYIHTNT